MIVGVLALVTIIAIVAGFVALRRLHALGRQHFLMFINEAQNHTETVVQMQQLTGRMEVIAGALDNVIVFAATVDAQARQLASNLPGGIELLSEDRSEEIPHVHGPTWIAPANSAIS